MNKKILFIVLSFSALFEIASAQAPQPDKTAMQQPANLEEAAKAQVALEQMIRAYEAGNLALFQSKLDPSMIGYQQLIDGIVKDINSQKRARINLTDTQVLAGPDVTVIQTRWEKRFISTGFAANLYTGRTSFLMHKSTEGWQISSMTGDALFASQSIGTLAQFTVTPSMVSRATFPFAAPPCSSSTTIPGLIEIVDPDMADSSSINIELVSSHGDSETISLPAVAPGKFARASLPFVLNTSTGGPFLIPGNTCIDINISNAPLPVTVTIKYVDNNPGNNRPTKATLSKVITVVP